MYIVACNPWKCWPFLSGSERFDNRLHPYIKGNFLFLGVNKTVQLCIGRQFFAIPICILIWFKMKVNYVPVLWNWCGATNGNLNTRSENSLDHHVYFLSVFLLFKEMSTHSIWSENIKITVCSSTTSSYLQKVTYPRQLALFHSLLTEDFTWNNPYVERYIRRIILARYSVNECTECHTQCM